MKPSFFNSVDRQIYKDSNLQLAAQQGFDTVQLKYDGWWSKITTEGDMLKHESATGREYYKVQLSQPIPSMILVGEHMFGTQWAQDPARKDRTFLFDLWKLGEHDLTQITYRDRISLLRTVMPALPSTFEVVKSWHISETPRLWTDFIVPGTFEGVVWRKKDDHIPSLILREKYTFTEDLTAQSFSEGEGKFAGMLGSICGKTKDNVLVDVGGGFDTEERITIWEHQDLYLGKPFEVEARKKFESGSLRHPNFKRWRWDK